ncbi:MAG: glycosyltransferase family 4 protein [Spirosomataceae bacterium]
MSDKLKILLLNTDDTMGGAAIACQRLMNTLNKFDGIEAKMLVQEKKTQHSNIFPIAKTWLQKKLALFRFAYERLIFSFFEKSKDVRFAFSIANTGIDISENPLVREADIIHLHWVNFGFLSIESIQKLTQLDKPIIWTLHDMWPITGGCHHSGTCENYQLTCGNCERYLKNPAENDLSNQIWGRKSKAFSSKINIVGCSQWLANRAKKSSLFKDSLVQSIPNPIDTDVFKPFDKQKIRTDLGLETKTKYILFVAAKISVIWKGFSYFISALEILKSQKNSNENIELIILGQAEEDLISQLPFRTHALGRINDVSKIVKIYNAADVFVIPSIEENLPNTIMEALSCGVPSVGFETGGIPEMIAHKTNGYLAEYKNPNDLAKGIDWVLFESDYELISKNARKKVLENYAQEVVAKKYVEVYKSII